MNTCTFLDFMQMLDPWLNDDYIKEARFDGNGKFIIMFADGVTNTYRLKECTAKQLEEATEHMRKKGVLIDL